VLERITRGYGGPIIWLIYGAQFLTKKVKKKSVGIYSYRQNLSENYRDS
jgi:hypothetical protein